MFLEMIVAAGCGWYLAKKVGNAASGLRSAVANLQGPGKSPTDSLVADIAARLRTRPDDDVRRKARMLADSPIVAVLEHATPEEREVLADVLARYCERTN